MARGPRRAAAGEAAPGHNGPSDELQRDYARRLSDALRDLREVMEEAASKRGTITGIKKAAAKVGINVPAMVRVVTEALHGQEELIAAERAYIRMRAVLNMPIAQADLFPADQPLPELAGEELEKQVAHQAGQAGYMAGINGHDIDKSNPHTTGTEPWVKFREQWHAGQAHLAKGLGTGRKPPTQRERRTMDPAPAAANDAEPTDEQTTAAQLH